MIGKIVGAFVGDKIAKQTSGVDGASGAALGVVATTILSRLSLPAMLAIGVGGYFAKKYLDKKEKTAGTADQRTPLAPVPKAA